MPVELNHTIVYARDKKESAQYLAELLNLPKPISFGPFMVVQLSNGVTLDFADSDGEVKQQHLAFKVEENEFDEIIGRIRRRKLAYWADPHRHTPGKINNDYGGRGVYFTDADDNVLEILTRDYEMGIRSNVGS